MFKTVTFVTVFALVGTSVSARDDRLLANKPSDQSISEFQSHFETTCPAFDATNPDGHLATYFHAGDFSGDNADSQALVYCSYTAKDGSIYTVTRDLVESLGGSIA
ncbi:hypothetical protein IAR50_001732 [Cryptococcus sp. DSM 104548]